jgi:hypothetical protein
MMQVVTVSGYELLEADGAGVHENRVAIMLYESDAKLWASQSNGWRSYKPFHAEIKVFESLDELHEGQLAKVREKALAKLTKEEREALGL